MKQNGFVFVETIVAIVILTSSLLLLYSSFNKILQSEKTRVYYDDVNYIYRTHYIKSRLEEINLNKAINELNTNQDKYFVTLGVEYSGLFTNFESERTFITNLLDNFDVNQIILLKENKIDNLKKCTVECSLDKDCREYENCNGIYTNLSEEMISYLKTIFIDVSCNYVLVIEYNTCNADNTNCKKFYSWVSV